MPVIPVRTGSIMFEVMQQWAQIVNVILGEQVQPVNALMDIIAETATDKCSMQNWRNSI